MKHLLRKHFKKNTFISLTTLLLLTLLTRTSSAYFVTELQASYRNGQVFLTWKSPNAKNLKYNVYRSKTKLVSEFKLNANTYLGSVRDSSSKNIRMTRINQADVFFKIEDDGVPLTGNFGLYVVTCSDAASYYYAVTVTNLLTGLEANKVTLGKNSLITPVQEQVADPQPVWQDSVAWGGGDVAQMYVQFVGNQDLPHYPAMTNEGSFGYNFYLIKRGNASSSSLFVFYEGVKQNSLVGNGLSSFADVKNCYIMGMDDWIPYPNGYDVDAGKGTFWCGYHEDYDIYSSHNPLPASGIVKTYTQKRMIQSIMWGRKYLAIDTTQVYLVGRSAGGYGVLLTANLIPEQIAAVYAIVEPDKIVSYGDWTTALWGSREKNLDSDALDPNTSQPIPIFDFMNSNYMLQINKSNAMPVIYCINGKNDKTIGWKEIPGFFDSLQINLVGGYFFWDQREHDGSGSNFLDTETMPDFGIYKTDRSYPAFSNCAINHDPGNGDRDDGNPYGAINGYLTWLNGTITDEQCSYDVKVKVKDFYVGGIPDMLQYTSTFSDITFRRLQFFKPQSGQEIKWKNFDYTNQKIQSGSFTYTGGPITLTGIQVDKIGNRIELSISDCEKKAGKTTERILTPGASVKYFKTGEGWIAILESDTDDDVDVRVYDLLGQLTSIQRVHIHAGNNSISIPASGMGLFFIEIKGNSIAETSKLEF